MNCRDFDQIWNRLLDAESGPRRDDGPKATAARLAFESSLREHAAECPACRLSQNQFETLRTAMRAWSARPTPEPEIADRILQAAVEPLVLPAPRRFGPGAGIAALAAGSLAAAAVLLAIRPATNEPPQPLDAPQPVSLSLAVADARDASWRLAQTASEPAARLMLDASFADEQPVAEAEPTASTELDSSTLLDRVGGYAAAGARPLSDAARQAFGFLRSPALEAPDRNAPAPSAAPKGA
ncbi:hypothetical protein [Paludisphaera rhizosphaerae]|uniref:hypothetical protein n=1 Tax=Paludisphaera rhizosphaerae TaxID=2711216 RepID=UPI0013ED79F2|nr:hypothetical protein [Paludisphaera rhizosphaerae]